MGTRSGFQAVGRGDTELLTSRFRRLALRTEIAISTSAPERWLAAHADALFRFAVTRLQRPGDAEDAVQETLLAALGSSRSFRGDSAERTWLIGILRHKIADHFRAIERREAMQDVDDLDELFDARGRWRQRPGALDLDREDLVENAEFWQQLERCLQGLPPRQARAFTLHSVEENNPTETCKHLGISATNLWVLLHRARLRLRGCLEANWLDAGEHR